MILGKILGNIRRPSKMFVWSPYWDRSRRCALAEIYTKDDGLFTSRLPLVVKAARKLSVSIERQPNWMWNDSEMTSDENRIGSLYPRGVTEGMFWQRPSNPDPACLRQQSFISLPWSRQDTLFHYPNSFLFAYKITYFFILTTWNWYDSWFYEKNWIVGITNVDIL